MAGTVVADTIQNGAGTSTSMTNAISGSAKAWVQFQGGNGNTAGTINGSFNVSSVTVNGTGNYTINFATAMTNANYAALVTSSSSGAGSVRMTSINDTPASGSVTVYSAYPSSTGGSSTAINTVVVSVAVFSS